MIFGQNRALELVFQIKFLEYLLVRMASIQKVECQKHKKICEYLCTYSKCTNRVICDRCRREHLQIHPQQFIFQMDDLSGIHSFDKAKKLKQMLLKDKNIQEAAVRSIYKQFETLMSPINRDVNNFAMESQELIKRQLSDCLKANKNVIESFNRRVPKEQHEKAKEKPELMLEQTIKQAQIINQCEIEIRQNMQGFKLYYDSTKAMITKMVDQIKSSISVISKLIEMSIKVQRSNYRNVEIDKNDHHQVSFYRRYHASHQVAFDKNKLEAQLIAMKRDLQHRDKQISKSQNVIKQKVVKIEQLQQKVQGLREQLLQWQQKKERQEMHRRAQIERQHRKKQQQLIKNGIIGSGGREINLEKKVLEQQNIPLILQIVPNALVLDATNHTLSTSQMENFLTYTNLQTFKYNFNVCDLDYLTKAFKAYSNLVQLQLNSCGIDDDALTNLSKYIPPKLKALSLIDNQITDEGLQSFFRIHHQPLEVLFVSYNRLTAKAAQIIGKYSYEVKKLHIAKNKLTNKGANTIARALKQIEQLFIGNCSIGKQGFLSICRNCFKLKRLSLVANQMSTEIISEILLGLKDLKWLDISYCNLSKLDLEKVEKLKIFNQNLTIITGENK